MGILNKTRLIDYKEPDYLIPNIFLEFYIRENNVKVISTYDIKIRNIYNESINLKGVGIEIETIKINGSYIDSYKYTINDSQLEIRGINKKHFKLVIASYINPYNNTELEGLYESNKILTTQCEAEGFRRICFHPDRPDVLSKYTVKVNADANSYPVILSNGNLISNYKLIKNTKMHEVIWSDPIPKSSYLFALVAGDLARVSDSYTTASGKTVEINIYVENGDQRYTKHALNSLKKAMQWDEKVYGLEYDLEVYNIVAIRHFNMGAMENKGLNIFNSKLILADSEIATDKELERIESVIAHEYFHNWTGNRVTCRDWFQLSLKEGLTVFRDQSFTSYLHSYGIKRIEDVSLLRSTQFKEDAGPTSHAVKPKEYNSIDNFYTTTIYEKGAEIIRMLQTLLGEENFIAGIKNYVKVFDGKAVTTEDFVNSMIEGAIKNGYKIKFKTKQFINWYYKSGTPYVSIKRNWDRKNGILKLIISQGNLNKANNLRNKPLVIPILISFDSSKFHKEELIILDKRENTYIFDNLSKSKDPPTISCFRKFSSPVNWETDLTIEEMLDVAINETDMFSRWNIFQSIYKKAIISRASNNINIYLEKLIINSLGKIINNYRNEENDFLSKILTLPSINELELSQYPINPIQIYNSKHYFSSLIANALSDPLKDLLDLSKEDLFNEWPEGKESRNLINVIWGILIFSQSINIKKELTNTVKGNSMTLSLSAINSLRHINCKERDQAMEFFYNRWKENPIILDTWFGLEASICRPNALAITKELLHHHRFDFIAPNSIRSLLGGFIKNTKSFHSEDGQGYLFIADQIIKIDKINPITASRFIKIFSNWKNYSDPYSRNMINAINHLNRTKLSPNSKEVIDLIIDNN